MTAFSRMQQTGPSPAAGSSAAPAARPQFVNHSPRSYNSSQKHSSSQQHRPRNRHPSYNSSRHSSRSLVTPRPLGDFAIDEEPEVQRKRGLSDMMIDTSSTSELARFLMTTAPPETLMRDDELDRRDSLVRRIGAIGFRKKQNKTIAEAIPDAVKESISSSGRRYYSITTDKYDDLFDSEPVEILPGTAPVGVTDSSSEFAGHSNRNSDTGTKSTSQRTSGISEQRHSLPQAKPQSKAPRRADVDDEIALTYTSYLSQQREDEKLRRRTSEESASKAVSSRQMNTGAPPSYVQTRTTDHSRAVSNASSALSSKSVAMHSHGLPPRTSSTGQAGRIPPTPPPPVPEIKPQGPVVGEHMQRKLSERRSAGSMGTDATLVSNDGHPTSSNKVPNERTSPRPGPPPMRSLPSLPEGQGTQRRPRAESAPAPSQPVPNTPPRIEEETFTPRQKSRTRRGRKEDEGAVSATEDMRTKRKSREERVKARKMRDLQSQRTPRNNSVNDRSGDARTEGEETGYTTGGGPVEGTLSDSPVSVKASGSGTRLASSSIRSARRKGVYRNSFSPIMLVVEQEPSSKVTRTSMVIAPPRTRPSRVSSMSGSIRGTTSPGRSPSPSLPSSDDGEIVPELLRRRSPTAGINRRRHESGMSLASVLNRDKEAEIERRVAAMERKNTLLETALLAVISQAASENTLQRMSLGQSPLERVVSAIGRATSPPPAER